MKKTLVFVVACMALFACVTPTLVLAADPDFWGVDSKQPPIGTKDEWVPTDDGGWSDGWNLWGDLEIVLHYWFGRKY